MPGWWRFRGKAPAGRSRNPAKAGLHASAPQGAEARTGGPAVSESGLARAASASTAWPGGRFSLGQDLPPSLWFLIGARAGVGAGTSMRQGGGVLRMRGHAARVLELVSCACARAAGWSAAAAKLPAPGPYFAIARIAAENARRTKVQSGAGRSEPFRSWMGCRRAGRVGEERGLGSASAAAFGPTRFVRPMIASARPRGAELVRNLAPEPFAVR